MYYYFPLQNVSDSNSEEYRWVSWQLYYTLCDCGRFGQKCCGGGGVIKIIQMKLRNEYKKKVIIKTKGIFFIN